MEKKKKPDVEAVESLLSELRFLRATIREAGEAFLLRTEGQIENLSSYLKGMSPKESRHISSTWLKEVRGTTFKPAKGRFKDLKKIDNLLDELSTIIIEKQSALTPPPRKKRPPPETNLADVRADAS